MGCWSYVLSVQLKCSTPISVWSILRPIAQISGFKTCSLKKESSRKNYSKTDPSVFKIGLCMFFPPNTDHALAIHFIIKLNQISELEITAHIVQ